MKLIVHIIWKDLRRLRGWLACWIVVLALPIVGGILLLDQTPDRNWRSLDWIQPAMVAVQLLFSYLLTLLVVQEDPVTGRSQFWTTRPIGGGRLLAAKVGAALFIGAGIPSLVALPWWMACGFGAGEIVAAGSEAFLLATLVVFPAMLVGALTNSLGRAVLWSMVVFAVAGTLLLYVPMLVNLGSNRDMALVLSRLVLAVLVAVASTAGMVGWLYRTRRYGLGLAGLAVVAGGLVLGAARSPWAWLTGNEPQEWRPERSAQVQVSYHHAWSRPMERVGGRGLVSEDEVRVSFRTTEPAKDLWMEGVGARQRWQWDETRLERTGGLGLRGGFATGVAGFKWMAPDPETAAYQQAMDDQRSRDLLPPIRRWTGEFGRSDVAPPEGPWFQTMTTVPSSLAAKMVTTPPRYDARLWLATYRPVVANEVPLRVGGWHRGRGHAMRISQLIRENMTAIALVVDARRWSWVTELQMAAQRRRWFRTRYEHGYLLLNRSRSEVIWSSQDVGFNLPIAGVGLRWLTARVWENDLKVRRNDAWVERPGWLAEASVAFVRLELESLFARDIQRDGLPLDRQSSTP